MIQKLREMAPTIMIVIIVAFVGGTLFLDWGMNVMGQGPATVAGKVNGKKITLEAFSRMVDAERFRRQDSGQEVSPLDARNIPRDVWNQEVSRIVLADAVKSMRLESTSIEVYEFLRRNPIQSALTHPDFMTEGVFDTAKYMMGLAQPNKYISTVQLANYEQDVRDRALPVQKLDALLKAGVFVTPSEAEFEYSQRNDKATFEFFKAEERRFSVGDSVRVSESMISEFYAANRSRFTEEERADLYFVRLAKIASEADIAANRERLLEIKARIESGETTFEAEAEGESEDDGSAKNGGDLDWFARGRMVKEFEDTAFSLDTGVISEPVKTMFGYHIIRVDGRDVDKETGETTRVKARHILLKDAPSPETLDALLEKAEDIRRKLFGKQFAEAAAAIAAGDTAVAFDSTGLFTRGDVPPKIGYIYGAGAFAFGRRGNSEALSEPLDAEQGVFILGIKNRTKKGVQPLELVRDRIESELKDTLAKKEALAHAQTIRARVLAGAAVDDIRALDSNIVTGVAEDQAVLAFQPQLGYASKAISVALTMPEGAVSDVIEDRGGFAVVRVLKALEPSTPDTAQIRQIAFELNSRQTRTIGPMGQAPMIVFEEWFKRRRDDVKVEDNIDRFYLD